eukprot:CAMPEP_0119273808 /NCGR_PEP_ID=MMETSP1329-20130426/10967_1 /TAXON_ID=114041 /ORGANISM="Genus nov. species nov., Strain RCC1024" /LENGTH=102 /DNA_ID=CAMNT_0007274053 /DNA_START=22 /DNA_END=327 /DNA_ORIENTATION=+
MARAEAAVRSTWVSHSKTRAPPAHVRAVVYAPLGLPVSQALLVSSVGLAAASQLETTNCDVDMARAAESTLKVRPRRRLAASIDGTRLRAALLGAMRRARGG